MRIALAVLAATFAIGVAAAQNNPSGTINNQATDKIQPAPKAAGDSSHSTGRTNLSTSGQSTPQGDTGPAGTASGGAPGASPQGQTPPGYQSAPDGSGKTIVDHKPADPPRSR
jgi:hypothetical protein